MREPEFEPPVRFDVVEHVCSPRAPTSKMRDRRILKAHGPPSLAYIVVNNKETLSQQGGRGRGSSTGGRPLSATCVLRQMRICDGAHPPHIHTLGVAWGRRA